MPKLSKKTAKEVASNESNFEPLVGTFHFRLRECDARESKSSDYPYWAWEYECVEDEYFNRRVWNNTSLSPAAQFKLKETFDAFGVDTDTDTDELIGQIVRITCSAGTINAGEKKGQPTTVIQKVSPADPDFKPAKKSDDDLGF